MAENSGSGRNPRMPNFSSTSDILNKMEEKIRTRSSRSSVAPETPLTPDENLQARAYFDHLLSKKGLPKK